MKQLANYVFTFLVVYAVSVSPAMALQGDYIAAFDAAEHVGNTVTVCGNVASATYAVRSQGKPTFLNLDKAYPKHIFTAVIFDGYRFKFAYAPESLEGKDICVHGLVESYKGKPQIKVRSPDQIKIN